MPWWSNRSRSCTVITTSALCGLRRKAPLIPPLFIAERGPRASHASHRGNQRSWFDQFDARSEHASAYCLPQKRRQGDYRPGPARPDLPRAIDLPDRPVAVTTRSSCQWLVQSRAGGSTILEAIQSLGPGTKALGGTARTRARLYLRQAVLVVQHVFHSGLLHYSPSNVSRRWPQGFRYLYVPAVNPVGYQKGPGRIPLPDFLGSCRRSRNPTRR